MPNYDFDPKEALNIRDMNVPIIGQKKEPKYDALVSKIVGKPVLQTNPKLIALITKYKQAKGDSDKPDDLFKNTKFIEELKRTV